MNLQGKIPPNAQELEADILGTLMLEQRAFERVASVLHEDCFYNEQNKKVFSVINFLGQNNKPIDIHTVFEECAKKNYDIKAYDVTKYINNVVSSAHLEEHAHILVEKYIARQLIKIGSEQIASAYDNTIDSIEALEISQQKIIELSTKSFQTFYKPISSLCVENVIRVDSLISGEIKLGGVDTGYPLVNKLTGGWQKSDLIIIAARPSVGKTALALNLAINAAKNNHNIGVFSLEMSAEQLTNRMIANIGEVNLTAIIRGRFYNEDIYNQYIKGVDKLAALNIFIDDTASLNIYQLKSKARQMVTQNKVELIIIDYLQLISGLGTRTENNRVTEISNISRGLKILAKELNIPIIALSQLSRSIETRGDKRPVLSDLRDSGAIEQDADIVIFPTREDYQQQPTKDPSINNNIAKLIFAKHRNGALDDILFNVDFSTQTWNEVNETNFVF